MMVEVNGAFRTKKGSIILTIYSSAFARYLLERKMKKVNINFLNGYVEISKGNRKNLGFERVKENHPLCVIYVTKLLPKDLINLLKNTKKQKSIRVIIKNIISKADFIKYNRRISYIEPKKQKIKIPKSELIKVGCSIACFRQNNRAWYRFSIRHRVLEEIAIKKEKVMVHRIGDKFYILKDNLGKEFNFYKGKNGHPLAYMQVSPSLITEKEKKIFMNGRRCISFKAFLSSKDFNLDISRFFMTPEERELAYSLLKQNINIRIPEMRKREADIVLQDSYTQIEVTSIMPRSKEARIKNNPHGEGIHLNARFCEGFFRVTKKITPCFFVVFHKEWMENKWVRDLCDLIKPRVIGIPTDFKNNWTKEVIRKIKQTLNFLNLKW